MSFTAVLKTITGIFKPAADLVDNLHTSDEERLEIKRALTAMETEVAGKFIDYEEKIVEIKKDIIMAEVNSSSWLTRNWRPLAMMNFLFIINLYWFGVQPEGVTPEIVTSLFDIIKWGLGGYVVGRSVEKAIPKVSEMMKKD